MTVTVRPLAVGDADAWRSLYRGYLDFYATALSDEQLDRVWGWLLDDAHVLEGLVAVDAGGTVVGLAHVREVARPSTAGTGGYLDDLFVAPGARGSGAADALLQALARRAAERGWGVVRWITAADNLRAQAVYDRHATRTTWTTYDLAPADGP